MVKKKLSLLLIIIVLFSGNLSACASPAAPTLTLMIYMCGSNLESGNGQATKDLMEMAGSGYDLSRVNLLVMTGGTTRWSLGFPTDALCIYQPGKGHLRMLHAFESMSMGSSGALTALLDYGYECYPADRYALILWDHGGGPMEGLCWDECYSMDPLTMAELCQALGQSPASSHRLDWIGFDACLMATTEVANLISPYASYMIASQETEPGEGWNYSFLKEIHQNQNGADTGRSIIDAYFSGSQSKEGQTLSCIDLDKIGDLSQAMDHFFTKMDIAEGNYARYSFAARHAKTYGKAVDRTGGYDLIDLHSLILQLEKQDPEAAAEAKKTLQSAIVYARSNDGVSQGLSIYHPYGNKDDYIREWAELYPQLDFSEGYAAYVKRFASYLFGNSDVSWADISSLPTTEEGIIALPLTKEQMNMFSSAQLDLIRWNESLQAYAPAGSTSGMVLQDETLFAALPEKTLRIIDAAGKVCGQSIPYHPVNEKNIGIYVNLCHLGIAPQGEALRIIPVDTSSERKSGRNITFSKEDTSEDTQEAVLTYENGASPAVEAEKISFTEAYGLQTQSTLTLTPPLRLSENIQVVHIPNGLTEKLSEASAVMSLTGAVSPEDQVVFITPVSLQEEYTVPATVTYSGPSVPLSSFVSISKESFDSAVTYIDLKDYVPTPPSEVLEADVLHLWLSCIIHEDDSVSIDQLWMYDPATGYWHQENSMPAPDLYTTAVFPANWLAPVTDTSGALHGLESWQVVGQDAACVVQGNWTLCFEPADDPSLCTAFRLIDCQNRQHESLPQPLW